MRYFAAPETGVHPAAVRRAGSHLVALPEASRAFAERMRTSQQEMTQLSMRVDAWMDQAAELHRIEADHASLRLALNDPTFVVTSLGEYGVDSFTPIVMAPNVATLGIGRVRDETRWEGDRPVRASMMTLVLSWDHRAFGGTTAAEFLVEVREMLEAPYRLLVD